MGVLRRMIASRRNRLARSPPRRDGTKKILYAGGKGLGESRRARVGGFMISFTKFWNFPKPLPKKIFCELMKDRARTLATRNA